MAQREAAHEQARDADTGSIEPRPALTYARSSDPLLALPVSPALKPNSPLARRILHVAHWPHALRLALTCTCIALNTLTANGCYAWPQYGPVVLRRMGITPAEGQVVVTMGICGTYLMAAPLGNLCDKRGPRFASFLSACLAAAGYGLFALLLVRLPPSTPSSYLYLGACYFLVGMAAVGSYFAALTTASLSFPRYPTLALSLPLSSIGLSSLFLSSLARLPVFAAGGGGGHGSHPDVDPVKFLGFLAAFVAGINLLSSVFMRILPTPPLVPLSSPLLSPTDEPAGLSYPDSPSHLLNPDERTPLLIGGPEAAYAAAREEAAQAAKQSGPEHALVDGADVHIHWDVKRLVHDRGFWCFGLLVALAVGPPEMVLSSIGSILTSLLPADSSVLTRLRSRPDAQALRSQNILILSLSSTLARLITGALADYLSPLVPPVSPRALTVRRSTLAAGCIAVLCAVFAYGAAGLRTERGLWAISAGTGSMYGAVFTLLPAVTSKHFGPAHFGLAWGMLSYFSALGSVVFSYVFAMFFSLVAEQQSQDGAADMCYGAECFRGTFVVSAVASGMAVIGLLILGTRWKL